MPLYNNPICKHALKAYEKHAAGIYTRVAFMKFQQELNKESAYLVTNEVIQDGDKHIYQVSAWQNESRNRRVVYNAKEQTFQCTCKYFESWGFPCHHYIHIMKVERLPCIPKSCFLHRWTKNTKSTMHKINNGIGVSDEVMCMIRYHSLISLCK